MARYYNELLSFRPFNRQTFTKEIYIENVLKKNWKIDAWGIKNNTIYFSFTNNKHQTAIGRKLQFETFITKALQLLSGRSPFVQLLWKSSLFPPSCVAVPLPDLSSVCGIPVCKVRDIQEKPKNVQLEQRSVKEEG